MTWLDSEQICVSNTLSLKNQIENGNDGVTHMRRDTSFSKSLKNVYAGKIRVSFHCLITMS